jgi:tRNA A-37 threonylcarbamoyl transferase component Bud32
VSELTGRRLGQYAILEEIGHGGMANVYRAVQTSIGREVAVKVLPATFLQDRTFLERFSREVKLIANLKHPRILPVHDFGEEDGLPYIVMAYMEGGTLADYIRLNQNGLPLDEVVRLVEQIAEGLDFAHRRGIIHRDFKPSNVLLDGDRNAYLADFGIAKVSEATAHLTGSGIVGTPHFMAPEMSEAGSLSPLVDIYALGVTLYQMLTGRMPYEAPTPMGILLAHVSKPVPDVRLLRPDLPDAVQVVIEKAMAKDPQARYQSARELASDLRAVVSSAGMQSRVEGVMAATPPVPLDSQATVPAPGAAPLQEPLPAATLPNTEPMPATPPRPAPPIAGPVAAQTARPRRRWLLTGCLAMLVGVVVLAGVLAVVLQPASPAFRFVGGGGDQWTALVSRGHNFSPSFSPDGSRIVFASDRDGDLEIYELGADGQARQMTYNNAADWYPSYSPDGSRIVFASNRDGDFEIYELGADGQIRQVTYNDAADWYPSYSPDGSRILFSSDRSGNFEIYELGVDGQVRRLTNNSATDDMPSYSPDGSRVVFASNRSGNFEIYALGADGQTWQYTNNPTDDLFPLYSPDGAHLAFLSNRDGDYEVYILGQDGQAVQLTVNHVEEETLGVSPTTGCLVFSSDTDLVMLCPAQ